MCFLDWKNSKPPRQERRNVYVFLPPDEFIRLPLRKSINVDPALGLRYLSVD